MDRIVEMDRIVVPLLLAVLLVSVYGCATQPVTENRIIVTGTNGNAVILAQLIPVGTVIAYSGSMTEGKRAALATQGWLTCNGASVNRLQFTELFSVIGTSHGNGSDPKSFALPDYRGYFLRGVSAGSGRDPDAESRVANVVGGNEGDEVGSVQSSAVGPHEHKDLGTFDTRASNVVIGLVDPKPGMTQTENGLAEGDGDGQHETRPQNSYVHYLIFSGLVSAEPVADSAVGQ